LQVSNRIIPTYFVPFDELRQHLLSVDDALILIVRVPHHPYRPNQECSNSRLLSRPCSDSSFRLTSALDFLLQLLLVVSPTLRIRLQSKLAPVMIPTNINDMIRLQSITLHSPLLPCGEL